MVSLWLATLAAFTTLGADQTIQEICSRKLQALSNITEVYDIRLLVTGTSRYDWEESSRSHGMIAAASADLYLTGAVSNIVCKTMTYNTTSEDADAHGIILQTQVSTTLPSLLL